MRRETAPAIPALASQLQPDSANEPETRREDPPPTPQSLTKHLPYRTSGNVEHPTGFPIPLKLSKKVWAPASSVKIPRLGFNTTARAQPGPWRGAVARIRNRISPMYCYTPITKHQARLLIIKPGAFDEQINASLLVVDDDQLGDGRYSYAALSYNWGLGGGGDHTIIIQDDPTSLPVKSMVDIVDAFVSAKDHKMIKVQPNLHEALKHMRDEKERVGLWVDALCINQFNTTEKEEQVLKMAQIYRKAYNVNVWLGSDKASDVVSDRAMNFIPEVIDLENHTALLASDVHIKKWANLYELLKWSWCASHCQHCITALTVALGSHGDGLYKNWPLHKTLQSTAASTYAAGATFRQLLQSLTGTSTH